jgi:hypothetical protein
VANREGIPKSILDRVAVEAAVATIGQHPPDLLPSRVLESFIRDNAAVATDVVAGILQRGTTSSSETIMWSAKDPVHSRPISAMQFVDRVWYAVLATDIAQVTGEVDRSNSAYTAFNHLAEADFAGQYVVSADVAAFYQSVQFRHLGDLVAAQTGLGDTAAALEEFLLDVTHRASGLPQNVRGSDQVSELVVEPIQATMIRRGFPTRRFNDDFRILVESHSHGLDALHRLEREMFDVNLHLNERKSLIQTVYDYEAWQSQRRERHESLRAEAELELAPKPVGYDAVEPLAEVSPSVIDAEAARKAITLALDGLGGTALSWIDQSTLLDLLRDGIAQLRSGAEPSGVTLALDAIDARPEFSRVVGGYLASLWRSPDVVTTAFESIARKPRVTDWQALWLLQGMFTSGVSLTADGELLTWVRDLTTHPHHPLLRARALLMLAFHRSTAPADILRFVDELPPVTYPDLAAAVGRASYGGALARTKRALRTVDPLFSRIAELHANLVPGSRTGL